MKSLMPWRNREPAPAPARWSDDWFGRALESPFGGLLGPLANRAGLGMPTVDVAEDKNEYTVRAEMPGMSEKDIDLTWHDGVLRIRGEKKAEKEEKKGGVWYRECGYGSFSREIPLGGAVDWKAAKATYRHGVLTVKLPKSENARKAISVTVN